MKLPLSEEIAENMSTPELHRLVKRAAIEFLALDGVFLLDMALFSRPLVSLINMTLICVVGAAYRLRLTPVLRVLKKRRMAA